MGRVGELFGQDVGRCGVRPDDPNRNFSISEVAVAAAIAPVNRGANTADLIDLGEHPGAGQVRHYKIALGIDIRCDVVRDLTRVVADANTPVKGGGAELDRPMFRSLVEYRPEPDVMTLVRAAAYRLLEREVLMPAIVKEIADRSVWVGPVQYHTGRNLYA